MLEKKRKKKNGVIFISILFLFFLGMFVINKVTQSKRVKVLNQIILDLENYKKTNKHYPIELNKVYQKTINWLYYASDTIRNTFSLSYSKGIMNSNTVRYDSEKKKWETLFNY